MNRLRPKSPFLRLVAGLKEQGKTLSVVETCCGGLIQASVMAVPGSSAVFYGGSVAYNTRKARNYLLNDANLHSSLLQKPSPEGGESEGELYIKSKMHWTAEAAKAFCEKNDVDYAIAEGGASGPTFRPKDLDKGFSVIAIAGKGKGGKVQILAQDIIHSPHANRQKNMELFADAAATLAADTIGAGGAQGVDDKSKDESTPWLDRATTLRIDKEKLKVLDGRTDGKVVVLRNSNECLFSSDAQLALLPNCESFSILPKTFLGLDSESGAPIFAIDVDESTEALLDLPTRSSEYFFDNTRTHAPLLTPDNYELALYATAMSQWKRTHKFCSNCGKPLQLVQGGTCMECTGCKSLSWPRQDPSIIVLITNRDGDKALLARSPRHPTKVHTALAGFVEAGETFEKAVMREAYEETGVKVDPESVTYLSSQPWPFPRSTMIGFRATADDDLPLSIDTNELVSAEWFDKEKVLEASNIPGAVMNRDVAEKALKDFPSLSLLIPPTGVLARSLIEDWLQEP